MADLFGAALRALDKADCHALVHWAQGAPEAPTDAGDLHVLLAHCDDGVVWGHRGSGSWTLSSPAFPEVSPPLRRETLQELRAFGEREEWLVWAGVDGLQGRSLADSPGDVAAWAQPLDDSRVLIGDRRRDGTREAFTLVADGGGSRHAVPLELGYDEFRGGRWPLRLELRHYLEQDPDTWAVRVAATRLVRLIVERSR